MMKKQKLIDELRDMRKEFALNKDAEMSSTISPNKLGGTKTSDFGNRNRSV